MILNTDIGTWPSNNREFFRDSDPIFIDDEGNFVGYVPNTADREIQLQLPSNVGTYEVDTGAKVPAGERGQSHITVPPGSARFIFLGTQENAFLLRSMLAR